MPEGKRVLVVVAVREEELNRARKHLGYDKLIVVAPALSQRTPDFQAALDAQKAAEIVEAPDQDLLGCLETVERVLIANAKEDVRVAVDGGTSAMSAGAFLACLSRGAEAWFLLAVPVRLPVLQARPIGRRFTDEQLAVLRALDERRSLDDLAKHAGLALEDVKRVCYDFKKNGTVRADASSAELTDLGRYYQRGLAPAAR